MRSSIRFTLFAAIAVLLFAPAIVAAPPTVPASLPYQGLLLDGLGAPRAGSVDLTVRVFDAVVGGALVYKQSFPAVSLADGVFSVQLGPVGEASDAPSNPLTTDLAIALGGDAGPTAPSRFLEVTVGSDGALTRTQILASAYALRATTAETANTATTAANATNVAGVAGLYMSEFFEHFNADGEAPPNFDASEGVADTDGDGLLNFVDSDNDGDTVSDQSELEVGSDINLVTPSITGTSPSTALFSSTGSVNVNGTFFQPPLSVVFGNQTPTPTSVTSTSFQVIVGPQPTGPASIQVTNANGQSDLLADAFTWVGSLPIPTFAHSVALNPVATLQGSLDARTGTNFVVYSGQKQYGVGNVTTGLLILPLASRGAGGQIATAFESSGRLNGLRCLASGTNCDVAVLADIDGDLTLEDETAIPIETETGTNAILNSATLDFDPSGRRVAGYQVSNGSTSTPMVAHDHSGDGDFDDTNEVVSAGSATSPGAIPSALAIDATGRVAYVRGAGAVLAAWDRNGDGDFEDTIGGNPELLTIAGVAPFCVGATFDSAGRLAVIYNAAGNMTLARDLNADGDFFDAGESTTLLPGAGNFCDIGWRSGQPLTVAYTSGSTIAVGMDKNDDGDFADGGESSSVPGASGVGLRLRLNGTTTAFLGYGGVIAAAPTN